MSIAAFFDLDGTLLPPPSLERRLLRFLAWRGRIGGRHFARWFAQFLLRLPRGFHTATDGNKAHLAGIAEATLSDWAHWLDRFPVPFYPAALRQLRWHIAQGHSIFIVSGTLEPLARILLARCLPFPVTLCATQLESRSGRWTGRTVGDAVCGPAKAAAIRKLAAAHQLDLTRSFAYGNRPSDRWMLASVGHPVAVNPVPALNFYARLRGWPVLDSRNRHALNFLSARSHSLEGNP